MIPQAGARTAAWLGRQALPSSPPQKFAIELDGTRACNEAKRKLARTSDPAKALARGHGG
jgi:hypothetical protein